MKLDPKSILPPVPAGRITSFEENHRIKLPDDFKHFLITCNGAIPITNRFGIEGQEILIERFLPLFERPSAVGEIGRYDISVVMTQLDLYLVDDPDLIGANIIPIARLLGYDFLCLDFRATPASPAVAIWLSDTSYEFKPDLKFICKNFSELVQSLY